MKKVPSKDNNQFGVDFDFPGLCCLCHVEIAEFDGSHPNGRPKIKKLKGSYHQLPVLLDDNSKMMVALCTDCFFGIKPEDMKTIMENVINGWESEIDTLAWDEFKKIQHSKAYSAKAIVNRADFPYSLPDMLKIEKPDVKKLKVRK